MCAAGALNLQNAIRASGQPASQFPSRGEQNKVSSPNTTRRLAFNSGDVISSGSEVSSDSEVEALSSVGTNNSSKRKKTTTDPLESRKSAKKKAKKLAKDSPGAGTYIYTYMCWGKRSA